MNSLITEYFEAFKNKDIVKIESILSQNIVLQDPVVGKLTKRDEVLKAYNDIFENCHEIQLETKRIYQANLTSFAVEFSFEFIDSAGVPRKVEGVDLINILVDKIDNIRAYLDTNLS